MRTHAASSVLFLVSLGISTLVAPGYGSPDYCDPATAPPAPLVDCAPPPPPNCDYIVIGACYYAAKAAYESAVAAAMATACAEATAEETTYANWDYVCETAYYDCVEEWSSETCGATLDRCRAEKEPTHLRRVLAIEATYAQAITDARNAYYAAYIQCCELVCQRSESPR